MSRQCDAFKCSATVATGRFMCSRHWRLVPTTIQQAINTRYRAGRKDFAFLNDVAYLQACVDAINHLARGDGHTQGDVIGDSSSYGRLLRVARARACADGGVLEGTNRTTSGTIGQP